MRSLQWLYGSRRRRGAILGAIALAGCGGAAIKANQQQLQQQQAELDQLKQQIQALQNQPTPIYAAAAPGACDQNLMREAARKGGERFAAGDFAHALPYYQDAVSACPQSTSAHLNLARTYEALHDATDARAQYQLAADANAGSDPANRAAAGDALRRLNP